MFLNYYIMKVWSSHEYNYGGDVILHVMLRVPFFRCTFYQLLATILRVLSLVEMGGWVTVSSSSWWDIWSLIPSEHTRMALIYLDHHPFDYELIGWLIISGYFLNNSKNSILIIRFERWLRTFWFFFYITHLAINFSPIQ